LHQRDIDRGGRVRQATKVLDGTARRPQPQRDAVARQDVAVLHRDRVVGPIGNAGRHHDLAGRCRPHQEQRQPERDDHDQRGWNGDQEEIAVDAALADCHGSRAARVRSA